MDTTKPIIKPVKPLQLSDLIAGAYKAFYNQDKKPMKILMTMAEVALYKTFGRIVGDNTSVSFLSGSGKDVRLVVDKDTGKMIEEQLPLFLASYFDNEYRKGTKGKKALENAGVDTMASVLAYYTTENLMGGDIDILSFIKQYNPFDPQNKPDEQPAQT